MERLQRILSARGVASRRVAEEMIVAGRVSVNGKVVTELGVKANPDSDVIRVDGKVVKPQRRRYVMLNKPRGFITTTSDERNRHTVMELVQTPERLYPVGRLDRETEGLLLLTNDGELANRVMHPRFGLEKEYHILTPAKPDPRVFERVRRGLEIEGRKVIPNEFRILRETRDGVVLTISLHEGMYHVVRRLMDMAGIPVERLTRVRVGPLVVFGIPVGTWRDLTQGEESTLFEAVHMDLPEGDAARRRVRDIDREQTRARTRRFAPPRRDEVRPEPSRRDPSGPRRDHQPAREQRRVDDRQRQDRAPRQDGQRSPEERRQPPAPQERRGPRRFNPQRDLTVYTRRHDGSDERPAPPPDDRRNQPRRRDERPPRPADRRDGGPRDHTGRPTKRPSDQRIARHPDHPRGRHDQFDKIENPPRHPRDRTQPDHRKDRQEPRHQENSGGAAPRHDRSHSRPPAGDRDRRPGRGGKNDRRPRSGEPDRGDAL